ncbi:heterokaryon incompatibility protein-domain-containing protein [Suillus lakei]|nr:heterokaryon incompatibility protein-domain-containing protein [Suillus lakei]
MRLLNTDTLKLETSTGVQPYAILSHRWLKDNEEVSFQDLQHTPEPIYQSKNGFAKIRGACDQAFRAGLKYIWIDTCCIDKTSSAELSEAINSMYAWYQDSAACYVYLPKVDANMDLPSALENDEWFQRGWTLQELIAPDIVYFFDENWNKIGSKTTFASILHEITGIRKDILIGKSHPRTTSIAERMSWAAKRKTQKVEDRAYSLMGLFDIHMPIIYGEGEKAFKRLQLEIMKLSDDQTIFAWHRGVLAPTPEFFSQADPLVAMDHSFFIDTLTAENFIPPSNWAIPS